MGNHYQITWKGGNRPYYSSLEANKRDANRFIKSLKADGATAIRVNTIKDKKHFS